MLTDKVMKNYAIGRVFFNWRVLCNLPASSLHTILGNIEELICLGNPYHYFNAHRIYSADFIDGFVCGLFRQYVERAVLERAMRCVTLMLLALASHDAFLSEVLTLCCLSASGSTAGTHLGTKLPATAQAYIELVRNLLLKSINDAWEQLPPGRQYAFIGAMCDVLPPFWLPAMTLGLLHPVTVTLSMRIFVICFLSCDSFRERHKDSASFAFMDELSHHAHQPDVVDVVFTGFLGHVCQLSQIGGGPLFGAVLPRGAPELQPFLSITLNLLKRTSQILLRNEQLFHPIVRVCDYFDHGTAPQLLQRGAGRTLRCCIAAICFCLRLGSKQKWRARVDAAHTQRILCTTLVASIKETMCGVLEWLADNYEHHHYVQHALYCDDSTSNPIDLVSWPLMCSFSQEDEGEVTAPLGSGEKDQFSGTIELASCSTVPTINDDEDDWELLPAVFDVVPKSYNLDRLHPREGFDRMYNACRSLYIAHTSCCIGCSDAHAAFRGGTRMSKFVLSLHRVLSAEVKGIGNRVEDARGAFLCNIWLRAAEHSIDCTKPSPAVTKNILALGKYALDRLVSGSAIAPASVSSFLRFVLTKMERNEEVQKSARTYLFEWLMYIMCPGYYKYDVAKAAAVIELLYPNQELIFACPIPVSEFVRVVLVRLMELSHIYMSGCGTAVNPVSRKLGSIWFSFINANRGATPLAKVLVGGGGGADLLHGGFGLLLPPVSSTEQFLQWLQDNCAAVGRCAQSAPAQFIFLVSEGGKYNRVMRKTMSANREEITDTLRLVSHLKQDSKALWGKFTDTATFVDPTLLAPSRSSFPSSCIIGCRDALERGRILWFWHACGAVGRRSLYEAEGIDSTPGEPLSRYIMYAPPVCVPLHASAQEALLTRCGLRRNASTLLAKITGPCTESSPYWIGNVYFVVGTNSHICTLTLTTREVVIISCSEATRSGDLFIARVRPHLVARKSRSRSGIMQEALRRIISYQSGGPVTNSEAVFHFSQCYRQVCTDFAADADPLVWRFPLLNVASLHQRLFQHMPAGLEFSLETGERFFVAVLNEELSFSKSTCDRLQRAVGELAPHIIVETMSSKRSRLAAMTRLWVNWDVSNFDYLAALNDAASRTVANVGQYPVMPWVLQEYSKDSIEVFDQAIYRDLCKPIGALNPLKMEQLRRRYSEWLSESEPPFHHGTHYSSAAIVYYYLLRLQPFTAHSISYQGGRLDIADRLFHSVAEAWNNSSGPGTGDVKELIPEFFRVSSFLLNRNVTPLGTRRSGENVSDVVLPPWARDNPALFVHFNALCLESDCVSEHLNEWIDLIFGHKQSGEDAANACNVFHHLSYQEGVEHAIVHAATEEERKSIVASADNFGQTPLQLFSKGPHPRRAYVADVTLTQHNLLATAHTMQVQSSPSVVKLGDGEAPVSELFEVADTVYGSTRSIVLSGLKPTVAFSYIPHVGTIQCTDLRQARLSATLPPVHSFGCGSFTCMCASKSGNLLCVGTERGRIIFFNRTLATDSYTLSTVMHSSGDVDNPVRSLALFDEGRLVATHEAGSLVTGWHISCLNTMHCFSLNAAPDTAQDPSPVVQVTMDSHQRVYYGARRRSVVIFTGEGVILAHVPLAEVISTISSRACLPPEAGANILSVAYCNCNSFSFENIIYFGLENGLLLLMRVKGSRTIGPADKVPYTINPHCFFAFSSAVTSVMVLNGGRCAVVGLQTGSIEQLAYPGPRTTLDDEPSARGAEA